MTQYHAEFGRDEADLATRFNHSAAPMVSGVILQFERALYHLAMAADGESVAVEQVDDVSRHKAGATVEQEQNKKTLTRKNSILGDRSLDLWRTLQIWVQGIRETSTPSARYLLVTNAKPGGTIAEAIRRPADVTRNAAIVAALKAAGRLRRTDGSDIRSTSKIQTIIDDVLSTDDDTLLDLAARTELVENYDSAAARPGIAARLGLHPDVDRDVVLDATMGWIVNCLKLAWDSKQSGTISKEDCLRYVRGVEARQIRRRWLPRPPRELPVAENVIANARGKAFVHQLERIELDNDEIVQGIEHWVRFNTERHRLALSGDIPDEEWGDRAERLRLRWENIDRLAARTHRNVSAVDRGYHVYSQTTYNHRENLGGNNCDELYMTAGHYHRLADDERVRWHPDYKAV
ncbi:ABC-three component system protein [Sphingobium rhizovicinum]|uniref:ABC-three component system protein n=1 Tax=Sphingobium rhizovicinum TaxID=432308 RepID=A0ABV7NLI9_9SPHN